MNGLAGTESAGQSSGLFDVHLHFVPEVYRNAANAAGYGAPDGMPGIPPWSETGMLEMMAAARIEQGILSISSPGIHFGDDRAACRLARAVNEEGARFKAAYPGKFGFFASIPLPDIGGALQEINYALDVLGADGIYLQSNARGVYPGESAFDVIFDELHHRKAVVFIHPTSPACSCCGPRERPMPRPVLDFMFETTRAVTNLILSGTLKRCPNIKLIAPHCGGALPVLADRIASTAGTLPDMGILAADEVIPSLGRIYYDLAGTPVPRQLQALRTFADPSHLLYGSDWPHTPRPKVERLLQRLLEHLGSEPEFREDVKTRNAYRLFPRLSVSGA